MNSSKEATLLSFLFCILSYKVQLEGRVQVKKLLDLFFTGSCRNVSNCIPNENLKAKLKRSLSFLLADLQNKTFPKNM